MKADRTHTTFELQPAIARLRQIAAEAGDHLLLGDGEPHPDYKLLDLCGELVSLQRQERDLWTEYRSPNRTVTWEDHDARRKPIESRIRHLLSAVKKLRATTGAGIYAKALVVRASKSGAAGLAMTLAEDLIACHGLRAALWSDGEPVAPATADNVVALQTRGQRAQL